MNPAPARALLALLLSSAASIMSAQPASRVLAAADYGAIPDDGQDDTQALQRLFIDAARQRDVVVHLAQGRYDVSADPETKAPIFGVWDAHGFNLEATGAFFAVSGIAPLFDFRDSTDIQIKNLTVDWTIRPSTGVSVVRVENERIIFRQQTPGPFTSTMPLEAIYLYDRSESRPSAGREECYWIDETKGPTLQRLEEGIFALPLQKTGDPLVRLALKAGDSAVIRFAVYGSNVLTFNACAKVLVSGVTILAAPGMGVVGQGSTDLELSHVIVRPPPNQWVSTCADATHFSNCRGAVILRDCQFESMGDDALNIHTDLFRVQSVKPAAIVLQRGKNPQLASTPLPRAGDHLALAPADHPLSFQPWALVESAGLVTNRPFAWVKTAGSGPPVSIAGDTIVNMSATAAFIAERVTVRRNRARGFLVQTPQPVHIEACTFERPSGSAIQITSDVQSWWEGPPVRNVWIRRCRFIGGNDGPGMYQAVVSVFATGTKAEVQEPVHAGIVIADNTFVENRTPAIRVASAARVRIEHNRFFGPGLSILCERNNGCEQTGNHSFPDSR